MSRFELKILGKEMGIYETPYEDFGRLTYAMWRACRLVIDTGVHHKGWTREQALAYLREHTALSEHEVTTSSRSIMLAPANQSTGPLTSGTPIVTLRLARSREIGPVRAAPSSSEATEGKRKQVTCGSPSGPWM